MPGINRRRLPLLWLTALTQFPNLTSGGRHTYVCGARKGPPTPSLLFLQSYSKPSSPCVPPAAPSHPGLPRSPQPVLPATAHLATTLMEPPVLPLKCACESAASPLGGSHRLPEACNARPGLQAAASEHVLHSDPGDCELPKQHTPSLAAVFSLHFLSCPLPDSHFPPPVGTIQCPLCRGCF